MSRVGRTTFPTARGLKCHWVGSAVLIGLGRSGSSTHLSGRRRLIASRGEFGSPATALAPSAGSRPSDP